MNSDKTSLYVWGTSLDRFIAQTIMAEMAEFGMQRTPREVLKPRMPPTPPATESGPERPKGARNSLSPPPRPNQYLTTSGDSSLTRPVSDWMRFKDHTLRPLGDAAVTGYGSGRSLGSIAGTVLICLWDFILPTNYGCKFIGPADNPIPRGHTQRSWPKEGGHTPTPPVSNFLTVRSWIPDATAEENFYFICISVVAAVCL